LKRLLPSDAEAKYTKSQPLGRLGHVRDVADATVYLLSEAGSYVTGQTLVGKSFPMIAQAKRQRAVLIKS
jgi:Dehydrogenases with different specificities (related to short-chain alcohol dehydrogenases)